MSAGFKLDEQVFWGTNGAVEAYVESLGRQAGALLGSRHPMATFFEAELEGFFPGKIVFLDELLREPGDRQSLLGILDAATKELLGNSSFSEYGQNWVATTMAALRAQIADH